MRSAYLAVVAVVVGMIPPSAAPAQPSPASVPASQPASAPAGNAVPDAVIANLDRAARPTSRAASEEEAIRLLTPRAEEVVKLALQAEQKYPEASNLHEVQLRGIQAANFLATFAGNPDARKTMLEVAERLTNSSAPAAARARGDFYVTGVKIREAASANQVEEIDRLLDALVQRYADTPAAVEAVMLAARLAVQADRAEMTQRYLADLKARHTDDPAVMGFLAEMGQLDGLPFRATLTRLDGSKLKLPNDLLGKVVVVDFWATWCGPCVAAMPHMKTLYAKYQPRGVEFVGISLDRSREALDDFVKAENIPWTQTFTGKFWDDPTARRYGVNSIPAVWVIGRDGKIFSTKTRASAKNMEESFAPLEGKIEEALRQPAPETSTQPAATEPALSK